MAESGREWQRVAESGREWQRVAESGREWQRVAESVTKYATPHPPLAELVKGVNSYIFVSYSVEWQ